MYDYQDTRLRVVSNALLNAKYTTKYAFPITIYNRASTFALTLPD